MDLIGTRGVYTPYGFVSAAYSPTGFANLLGINVDSTEFRSIMLDLDSLRLKYLDINACSTKQIRKIRYIGNQLIKKYPQLFTGVACHKNLFYAIHIIMLDHIKDRVQSKSGYGRRFGKGRYTRRSDPTDPLTMPMNASPLSGLSLGRPHAERLVLDCVLVTERRGLPTEEKGVDSDHDMSSTPTDATRDVDVPAIVAPISGIPLSLASHTPQASRPVIDSRLGTLTTSSQCTSKFSSSSSAKLAQDVLVSRPTDMPLSPPMLRYLQRFVEFGCTTSTHLRSISLWRPERRYNLLRKILGSGDLCPHMDIAILGHHLGNYFSED